MEQEQEREGSGEKDNIGLLETETKTNTKEGDIMKKMKTLFLKDKTNLSRVTNVLDPDCEWVYDKGVEASRKLDGTACALFNGAFYKRWDNKKNKPIPEGSIECQEADKITGHHPYWVLCDRSNPAEKWHWEAFDRMRGNEPDGTFELIGPRINGNPEKATTHILVRHGLIDKYDVDEVLNDVKGFLEDKDIEGIVFKHPDGRMCKIRKKDFGMKR